MARTVADQLVSALIEAGVQRLYGIVRPQPSASTVGSSTRISRPTRCAGTANSPARNQRYPLTRATPLRSAHAARFITPFLQHTTDN